MKIELEERELTYLANMLASIIVAGKEFDKSSRKRLEKLRDRIMPPRSAARISQTDLKQLLNIVTSGIEVCTNGKTKTSDEGQLKHLDNVIELLGSIQGKLLSAMSKEVA